MKIIFLILLISSFSIFSEQRKIEIIDIENNSKTIDIDMIKSIDFDLENAYYLKSVDSDGIIKKFELTSNSSIKFENDNLILTTNDIDESIALSNLDKIIFEKKESDNPVPFGELIVDEVLLNNLINPWSLDFIDEDNIIFNEIDGRLFVFNIITKVRTQIEGVPQVTRTGQGGLLDVTLHPNFNENKLVYLAYAVSVNSPNTTAIGRGKLEGDKLVDFEELFRGDPLVASGVHFGCRIVFDNNNKLYFAIGDRGNSANAQDSTNHYGSVLRINDDGTIPNDNPYLDKPGAKKELYTMGNRNIQGMFYVTEIDQVWSVEHGPRGGDELNIVKPGANYAWPLATYGINYDGSKITDETSLPGYEDPITYWVPSIAPCGMDVVSYDAETNELDVVIGALAGAHIHRLKIRDEKVIDVVRSLEGYGRFRDIQLSPDGYLYAVTQSPGTLIRLKTK